MPALSGVGMQRAKHFCLEEVGKAWWRRWHLSCILKNAEESPRQRKRGRGFQIEGTVCDKPGGRKRIAYLEIAKMFPFLVYLGWGWGGRCLWFRDEPINKNFIAVVIKIIMSTKQRAATSINQKAELWRLHRQPGCTVPAWKWEIRRTIGGFEKSPRGPQVMVCSPVLKLPVAVLVIPSHSGSD